MDEVFPAWMRVNVKTQINKDNFLAWATELVRLDLIGLVVYESNQAWTLTLSNHNPKSKFNMIDFQVYEDSIHLFINLAAEHKLSWQKKLLVRLLKLAKNDPRRAAQIMPLLRDQGEFEKITAKVRALVLASELTNTE